MIRPINSINFAGLHPYGTGNDGGIRRAQEYGSSIRMAQRVDEFTENMRRRHEYGLVTDAEYNRFLKSSFADRVRHLQSPCTPCY